MRAVRIIHRHRKGVDSISAGRPIVDTFSPTADEFFNPRFCLGLKYFWFPFVLALFSFVFCSY